MNRYEEDEYLRLLHAKIDKQKRIRSISVIILTTAVITVATFLTGKIIYRSTIDQIWSAEVDNADYFDWELEPDVNKDEIFEYLIDELNASELEDSFAELIE